MSAKKSTKKAAKEAEKPAEAQAPAGTEAKVKKPTKAKKEPKPKKLSALDAAAKVLEDAGQPMTTKEMIDAMAAKKLWSSPNGQTPAATLHSAILREINVKGKDARFKKTERGKFASAQTEGQSMRRPERHIRFEVRRGQLVRHVALSDGRGYTHHCTRDTLEQVALVVEQRGQEGVTTNELWAALPELPCTQVSVALEYLKARGCVRHEGRRSYAASGAVVEDALTEYHVLADAGA